MSHVAHSYHSTPDTAESGRRGDLTGLVPVEQIRLGLLRSQTIAVEYVVHAYGVEPPSSSGLLGSTRDIKRRYPGHDGKAVEVQALRFGEFELGSLVRY